jgi:hypothetical protein
MWARTLRSFLFRGPVKGQPLNLMMETDSVSDTTCLKKSKMMDNTENKPY